MDTSPLQALWLSLKTRPGGTLLKRLLKYFESLDDIYKSKEEALLPLDDITDNERKFLLDKSLNAAEKIMYRCFASKIQIVTYEDYRYPEKLRAIDSAPPVLYSKGEFPDFNKSFSVSVVGAREMTPYGAETCASIVSDLAVSGTLILSGLALGIDGVASASALAVGGKTCAVLACGVDIIYPKTHAKLYDAIVLSGGAVISEYQPGTSVDRTHFVHRNRLFAAMTDATFVIEGKSTSGTAVTAKSVIEYKHPLYTIPENITEKNASLSLELVRQGAKPISSAFDIYSDFEKEIFNKINLAKINSKPKIDAGYVISKYDLGMKIPYQLYMDTFEKTEEENIKDWLKTVFMRKSVKSGKYTKANTDKKLSEFKIDKEKNSSSEKIREEVNNILNTLGDTERVVYEKISKEEMSISDIIQSLPAYPYADVLSSITMLELCGLAETLPGDKVRTKNC